MGTRFFVLVLALIICIFVGYIAALYTVPSIPWFAKLIKPDLTPPAWVFQWVWSALYVMMGVALYGILQAGIAKKDTLLALIFFAFQLFLNLGWSYLFFGLHSIFFAFLCIIALWAILLCTVIQTLKVSVSSAAFLLPYLFWVTFVTFLNYLIMTLNPISFEIPIF